MGIAWLFAGVLALLVLVRRLRLLAAFAELGRCAHRAQRLVRHRGSSDYSKERATRLMALRMLGRSLRAGALLALAVSPLALLLALDPVLHLGIWNALGDWHARAWLALTMVSYGLLRRSLGKRLQPR